MFTAEFKTEEHPNVPSDKRDLTKREKDNLEKKDVIKGKVSAMEDDKSKSIQKKPLKEAKRMELRALKNKKMKIAKMN